jgi:hypothetical protein
MPLAHQEFSQAAHADTADADEVVAGREGQVGFFHKSLRVYGYWSQELRKRNYQDDVV